MCLKFHLPKAKTRVQVALHKIEVFIFLCKQMRDHPVVEVYFYFVLQLRKIEIERNGLIGGLGILPESMLRTQKFSERRQCGAADRKSRIENDDQANGYNTGNGEGDNSHIAILE